MKTMWSMWPRQSTKRSQRFLIKELAHAHVPTLTLTHRLADRSYTYIEFELHIYIGFVQNMFAFFSILFPRSNYNVDS